MPKQASSQWDFAGELFPAEATRRVFTVGELTSEIRRLIERHLGAVWVSGEITNLRTQSSGHIYFTLKDAAGQLNCVVFRADPVAGRQDLQDGRRVVLKGQMTVYEPRGQYQLQVQAVELQGIGALQAQFERLKQKLAAEGLFAPERKRELPRFPQRIGLITSPTGAAIRDVLHVVERRNPSLRIIFAPAAVQGAGAAPDIVSAIRLLNEYSEKSGRPLDAILLTRGGGSLEDLWAFNEESVARAIFHSTVPVVSAVGHEIDFSISDFVADLRAATPSAAAELLTEGVFAAARWVVQVGDQLAEIVRRRVAAERRHCQQLEQRLQSRHPRRLLNEQFQRLDDLRAALTRCLRRHALRLQQRALNLRERLGRIRPDRMIAQRRAALAQSERALQNAARRQLLRRRERQDSVLARLRLLGPQQTLARGYSITTDAASGQIIRRAADAALGGKIKTRFAVGEATSVVESAQE